MLRLTAPLLSLLVLLAGCIQLPDDPSAPGASQERVGTPADGSMTGRETRTEDVTPCADAGILSGDRDQAFCAKRTITVAGTISGIPKLNVDLQSYNGDVVVAPSAEAGSWGFEAVLTARGASADEARQRLDLIQFSWAHEEGARHFLDVRARPPSDVDDEGDTGVTIAAALPRDVVLVLAAATANGDVGAQGLRTDGLALATANGDVVADADVTGADLRTANGDVEATLVPTDSGRVEAATSNGRVRVALPEDARHGYDLEGTTSNGEVKISLRDGELGECPKGSQYYTPPCNHRTFRTSGYDRREVRTSVELATSNGDVIASPA